MSTLIGEENLNALFEGMNEYASSLLYVMRDESLAYLCLCSLMRRIRANFAKDGVAIATKFHHLKILLKAIDPVYWHFFEMCDAGMSRISPCDFQSLLSPF